MVLNLRRHRYIGAFLFVIIAACGSLFMAISQPQKNLPRPPLLCRSLGEPGGVCVTWQSPDRITSLTFPQPPGLHNTQRTPDAFCFWQDKFVWWAKGASLSANDQGTGLLGLLGDTGTVHWVAPTPPMSPWVIVFALSRPPLKVRRPDGVRMLCDTIGDPYEYVLEIAPLTGRWRKVSDAELQREREQQGYLEVIGDTRLRVHPPNGGKTRLITDCRHPELAVYDAGRDAVAYNNTYTTTFRDGQIAYSSRAHVWTHPGPGAFNHLALTIRPESGEIWTADIMPPPDNNGLRIYAPDGRCLGWRTRLRFPAAPYIELTPRQEAIVRRLTTKNSLNVGR